MATDVQRAPSAFLEAIVASKEKQRRSSANITFPTSQFTTAEFCEVILGFTPTAAQCEIFDAVEQHDRVAVRSGRHVGKSRALGAIGLHHFCSHEEATVAIVGASEPQLREVTMHDLIALFHDSGRCVDCRMRDPNGPRPCAHSQVIDGVLFANIRSGLRTSDDKRRLFGRAPRDPDFARGLAGVNLTMLLDESSAIPDAVYEVCDGNLAGGGRLAAFGNAVQRVGWFFKAHAGELEFKSIAIDSRSSINVKMNRTIVPGLALTSWIEKMRREVGEEDSRWSEVSGDYAERDATRLISDVELGAAFDRHATVSDLGDLVFGIDPAGGGGGDRSVIVARRGSKVLEVNPFDGDTDIIVATLVQMRARWRLAARERWHVNFDGSSSWGADLGNALRKCKLRDDFLSYEALDMKGGSPRTDLVLRQSKCARRVDAYWLNMTVGLKTSVGLPFDAELREELLFAEWETDRENGTRLRDKRTFRKLIGRSPDRSDALAFCLWEGRVAAMSDAARPGPGDVDDEDDADDPRPQRQMTPYDNPISPYGDDHGRGGDDDDGDPFG